METFIIISKHVRSKYKKQLPFIQIMCKRPQREDVRLYISTYLDAK